MSDEGTRAVGKDDFVRFLGSARTAVPGGDLQYDVLTSVIRRWREDATSVLDLGFDDGALAEAITEIAPGAHVVIADRDAETEAAARKRFGANPRVSTEQIGFRSPGWPSRVTGGGSFDIVVSGYAIHHLSDDRKRALFAEIFGVLVPGGVFLCADRVASASDAVRELYDEYFIDYIARRHATDGSAAARDSIARLYYGRPERVENALAGVAQQTFWLEEAGFDDVDCFFRVFELALFGGRRPVVDD